MDLVSLALALAAASLVIELTQGPNMAWLALLAASEGRRRGFAAAAVAGVGLGLMGGAAALGLAALLQAQPAVYQALRWAGLICLLWLAVQAWRGAEAKERGAAGKSALRCFRQGVITNVFNPKAAVFYVTVLPGFLPPMPGLGVTAGFSAIYVAVATMVHGVIVGAAGSARSALSDPARVAAARRVIAVMLVGVAVWLYVRT